MLNMNLQNSAKGFLVLVEWLDGCIDHGDGFDHWDGPVMADGGNGHADRLSSG